LPAIQICLQAWFKPSGLELTAMVRHLPAKFEMCTSLFFFVNYTNLGITLPVCLPGVFARQIFLSPWAIIDSAGINFVLLFV